MGKHWNTANAPLFKKQLATQPTRQRCPLLLGLEERHSSLRRLWLYSCARPSITPKSLLCRRRQCLTPFLPFFSALFRCRTEEEELNKDLFLPKAASCTASFLPANFHLSWHNHPVTGLKVIRFPSDVLMGNHPPFKVQKKKKKIVTAGTDAKKRKKKKKDSFNLGVKDN